MPPDPQRGEDLYMDNCWQCHGKKALGDGPLAQALPTPPPALAGRWTEHRFDEIVATMRQGQGDMPGFSAVFDRHNARRILVWLATLDSKTGEKRGAGKKKDDSPNKAPAVAPVKNEAAGDDGPNPQ